MNDQEKGSSALHHVLIRTLIDTGACPTNQELQHVLRVDEGTLQKQLKKLEEIHGIVLHPSESRPWVIHPFSLTPTGTYVEGKKHGWWAPCLWCGFGVAALVGGEIQIHTRLGGEAESVVIPVRDGYPVDNALCVHFAIPPRQAWNNVHAHCAMLLPFRSEQAARAWSARHGLPFGEVVPLAQTAAMARAWYGHHADEDLHKWTVPEAQEIFNASGLRSAFWELGERASHF